MKRIGLFLLAVVLTVGVAGCGGGGSSDPAGPEPLNYNFNGRWMVSSQVTKNTCGSSAAQGEIRIAQSAGTVIVEIPGSGLSRSNVGRGVCDTATGAILFDMPYSDGVVQWDGKGIDPTTMEGTRKSMGRRCEFEANWTAILIGR